MLGIIARFLRILNSETEPGQISLGFCFALIVGLTPLWSLHNVVVLLLVLILRVNVSAFLLGFVFFSGLAYLLDPIFHSIGLALLTNVSLEVVWTSLYNSTLWRLERFNNSIVMGSLVFSIVACLPLYVVSTILIRRYRAHVLAWVQRSRMMHLLKASKLYRAYQSVSGVGGSA